MLDQLGEGGMGVVLLAYDPKLDRQVALKVLRPEAMAEGSKGAEHTLRLDESGEVRDLVRERLLAEGRAMARLSHPNLVPVYEVGAVGETVFLAMEHVEGVTLSAWLEAEERSWRQVVRVFAAAGTGLHAAHQADLVHGDFKPDNVLVEPSGRVRVLDFGLARAAGTRPEAGLVGTPRYMAPEQLARRPTDARSDQFAFAISLYQALYRQWPFAATSETDADVAAATVQGKVQEPSRRRGPRWLQRLILRSLSADPEARFSSMEELVSSLRRRSQPRGRLAAATVAASLALVLGVAWASGRGSRQAELCTGGQSRFARVFDAGDRRELTAAFEATGLSYAKKTSARVVGALDDYGRAWTGAYRDACETAARGEQSEELLDRRMACLDRRLQKVEALVNLVAGKADREVVDRAGKMVAALEPIGACADTTALLALAPLPSDPEVKEEVEALQSRIDQAEVAWDAAGRAETAVESTGAVLEAARAVGYQPLLAEAAHLHGRVLEDLDRLDQAREAFLEAQRSAERGGDARLAAAALIDLIVAVRQQAHLEEARLLGRVAEGAIERTGTRDNTLLRARLKEAIGYTATLERKLERAEALHREALALRRGVLPPDDPRIASSENGLGTVLSRGGAYEEARARYREALDIRRRFFGDDHPLVAGVFINLGVLAVLEGRRDRARDPYLEALRILEDRPEHQDYPILLNNLGSLESSLGKSEAARGYLEQSLRERRRRFGETHPHVATTLLNLGIVDRSVGDLARALEVHRSALSILRQTVGEEHPRYASALSYVGEDLRRLGRPREALDYQERALEVLRVRYGSDHMENGSALALAGAAEVDLGRHAAALSRLERALELLRADDDHNRGIALFSRSRALAALGRDRDRALELAREARALLAPWQLDAASIDGWLARQ